MHPFLIARFVVLFTVLFMVWLMVLFIALTMVLAEVSVLGFVVSSVDLPLRTVFCSLN